VASDEELCIALHNSANGVVQIGQAGGDVVVHQVTHHTVVHHHHAQLLAQHAPLAPPARLPGIELPPPPLTLGHKKLLALMKPLPKATRILVLNFMREHYGTGMVRELSPTGLAQTYLHVRSLAPVKTHELALTD
jgi:hypothetical protein